MQRQPKKSTKKKKTCAKKKKKKRTFENFRAQLWELVEAVITIYGYHSIDPSFLLPPIL